MLGIGRSKAYELLASRRLGSVKIGSCRRIPADALRAYVLTADGAGVVTTEDRLR